MYSLVFYPEDQIRDKWVERKLTSLSYVRMPILSLSVRFCVKLRTFVVLRSIVCGVKETVFFFKKKEMVIFMTKKALECAGSVGGSHRVDIRGNGWTSVD